MEIETEGIVIAKHKFKESSFILTLFTKDKGVLKGVCKAGSKQKSYILQLGNVVKAFWKARLEEHLGSFKVELISSNIPTAFNDMSKLLAIETICEFIYSFIPERDAMLEFYKVTKNFLNSLTLENFFTYYVYWELSLLKNLGYGLDFSKCGVCNISHELKYISPKTGVAVCEKVGIPYKNKLLILPNFFSNFNNSICKREKAKAVELTSFFINNLCEYHNKSIPSSRDRLIRSLT